MRNFIIDQPFILAQAAAPASGTTSTGPVPEAPAGSATTPPPGGGLGQFLPMILIFAAFWFLLIAPQRKRQKQLEKTISELKPGDSVITSSGIYGRIESVKDDRFIVKISDNGTKIELAKSHVSGRADGNQA